MSSLPKRPDRRQKGRSAGHVWRWPVLLIALTVPLVLCISPAHARRGPAPAQHGRAAAAIDPPVAGPAETQQGLQSELSTLQDQKRAAEQAVATLTADLRRLQAELGALRQASANVLQIQAERDNLQEQLIRLERELVTIRRAKTGLEEDSRQTWFLAGAGVLLAGIVGGLVLPRLSWRRRNGWDSF